MNKAISAFFDKVQAKEQALGVKPVAQSYYYHHKPKVKQVVILVHGFSACPATLKSLAQYLFEEGLDVYGVRLAGHGTKISDFEQSQYSDWMSSLQDVYEALRPHYQYLSIAASSMGALLGLNLATKYKIDNLLCMGTFIKAQDPWFKLCCLLSPLDYLWPFSWGAIPNETIPHERKGFWYEQIPRKSVIQLYRLRSRVMQRLDQVNIPTLVAHAPNDPVAHPDSAHILLKQIATPYKSLLWLGKEHVLALDKDLAVYRPIVQFLSIYSH
eukprot:COSAG01_NODE_5089_length_4494_cov_2.160865_2_plen_270_part_00